MLGMHASAKNSSAVYNDMGLQNIVKVGIPLEYDFHFLPTLNINTGYSIWLTYVYLLQFVRLVS